MDLVAPKNTLSDHININTVKNDIVELVQKIPNYQVLKNDVELIQYIAIQLQNNVKAKNYDLTQTILDIMTIVFSLSDSEKASLYKVIEFLINNELVKKATSLKRLSYSLSSYFKKKIL